MFPYGGGMGGGMGNGYGMMGGGGFGMMPFEERYHAVPVAAADKSDTSKLEAGGKIMLPPSALQKLAQLEISYPMLFELTNTANGRKLHCGVLEFIANEGSAFLPHWMMENLGVEHGSMIKCRSATLPKGTYVKLRPQTKNFIDIANPKAVLENTLRNFSALTKGSTIRIFYNTKQYDIDVVDIQPRDGGAISIVDTDVNVDFDAPADYVEPVYEKPKAKAAPQVIHPKP
ncbi:ubiquitin fusion degradation protein UFD1-domain-containing protein [Baffinella frigidus]|nr:ubiquitin fusion degradation protein UFD1-domain-containing protein [Cryptophyta sp. CCMP2293]